MKVGLFNNIQTLSTENKSQEGAFIWENEKDSFVKSKPSFKGVSDNIPQKSKVESKTFVYDGENVKKNKAFLEEIKDENSPYHNLKIDKDLLEKIFDADLKELLTSTSKYGNFCLHYAPKGLYLYLNYDKETNTYSIEEAVLTEREEQVFVNSSSDKQLENLVDGFGDINLEEFINGFENEKLTQRIRGALEQDLQENRASIERTMQVLQMNKIKAVKDFKKIHDEYESYKETNLGMLAFLVMRSELEPKYLKEFGEVFNEGFIPENTLEENIDTISYYQKFLKLHKITSQEQFVEKFGALKDDFDDFEKPEDIFKAMFFLSVNLIDAGAYEKYLKEYDSETMTFGEFIESKDCDEKLEELDEILPNIETGKKNKTSGAIYQNYRELIDYYWEENNGNLVGFDKYLEKILEYDGKMISIPTRLIDKNQQNQASKTNINFAKQDKKLSIKDKFELLKTLIKYELEPTMFQALAEKNLQDIEFKTYLENFANFPSEIADATGLQEEQAKSRYTACKNIYTALTSSELGLSAEDVAKFIAKFKIENDESLNAIGKNIENGFKKAEKRDDTVRIYKLLAHSNIKSAEELAEFNTACKKIRKNPAEEIKSNEKRFQDFTKDFEKYKKENSTNPEFDDVLKNANELYIWQNYFKMFGEIKNMTTSQILDYISEENLLSDEDYFAIPQQLRNSKDNACSSANAINSFLKNTDNKQIKEFFAKETGETITEKYSDILTAEVDNNNKSTQIARALIFISNFEIKDNNDFKSKFKDVQSKEGIRNLISSLTRANIYSYEDYELLKKHCPETQAAKYIKDNGLPQFAKELSVFKEENPDFANKLKKNDIDSPTKLYFEFKELFNTFKENNRGECFKNALSFLEKSNISSRKEYEEKLKPFYEYLETEKEVVKYIFEAGMDFSKESYSKTCLNVLKAIHDKKNPDNTFKKAEKFARNFLSQSRKTETKNKTPYETLKEGFVKGGSIENTKKFINFIEKKKIASIEAFNTQFDEFKDENGSAAAAIMLFKNCSEELTLEEFIKRLNALKKSVENFANNAEISNPALKNIDYSLLKEDDLKLDFKNKDVVFKSIKKLTHGSENKSILTSFTNCYTNETKNSIFKSSVARELVRIEEKDYEHYDNIKRALKLTREDLGLDQNSSAEEYEKALHKSIPQEFMDFINSDVFSNENKRKNKIPKISTHAKMRLIDRFLLNDGKDSSYLYSKQAKEEIRNLLKTVYDKDPAEIKLVSKIKTIGKDATPKKENAYKIVFDFNSKPCSAVFAETGLMETIFYKD